MKIAEHILPDPEIFKRYITIRVALPDSIPSGQRIPMMIVHDAQNFFDDWEGSETKTGALPLLDGMFREGLPPLASAGIDTWESRAHLERFTEYSPWESADLLRYIPSWTDVEASSAGGGGISLCRL